MFVPYSTIWNFDRGKLIIPNVSIEYNLLENVMKSHSQVTKVVRRTRNEPGKIRALLAVTSSFIENFKISHSNARVAEMCRTLCIAFGEGEEDFIPMGLIFIVILLFVSIHLFVLVDEIFW